MPRRILAAIALIGAVPAGASCPCPTPFLIDEAVAAADAVFLGSVVCLAPVLDKRKHRVGTVATLDVVATWKGIDQARTTLYAPIDEPCGVPFSADATYIVFGRASGEAGRDLETDRCAGTRRVAQAADELAALGPPATGTLPEDLP